MFKIGLPKALILKLLSLERAQLANRFISLLQKESGAHTCLEIGGPNFVATDILVPKFKRYYIINVNRKEISNPSLQDTVFPILGSGCHLPFTDKSVDYIFCNAVIEHIPRTDRPLMAREIQRVCKNGFFVSTPNYWFPFEPHYHLPFFQYIPEKFRGFVSQHATIGFMKRQSDEYIRLLTPTDLKSLFPKAERGGIRTTLIPEIIYTYSIQEKRER